MSGITFAARPPAEAVDYLQRKVVGGRFSFDWRDVQRQEHLNAFVVAKAMQRDLLEDIHGALMQAELDGWSRERFIQELTPTLQAKGWWGKARVIDPLTGREQLAQLGSRRRLKTIFDVNMRMAHAAGRWERMARSFETRPYIVYHHTPQERPRPQHLAWDKLKLRHDHPFWKTHAPPNGWHCKCFVTSERTAEGEISDRELELRGYGRTRPVLDKRTGQVNQVPVGIDYGFDYNVGQARLANFTPPPVPERQREAVLGGRNPAALPAMPRGRGLPAGLAVRPDLAEGDAGVVFEAFSKALGKGEGEVFIDRAQVPIVAGRRMFQRRDQAGATIGDKAHLVGRAEFAEVLGATLRDPDEIWHSVQLRADGTSSLVRNYVARWKGVADRELFVVSYHEKDGVWWGTTALPPGRRGAPRSQQSATDAGFRVGVLVYRRK